MDAASPHSLCWLQALLLLGEQGGKPKDVVTKALAAGLVGQDDDAAQMEIKVRTALQSENYGFWHRVTRGHYAHTAYPSVRCCPAVRLAHAVMCWLPIADMSMWPRRQAEADKEQQEEKELAAKSQDVEAPAAAAAPVPCLSPVVDLTEPDPPVVSVAAQPARLHGGLQQQLAALDTAAPEARQPDAAPAQLPAPRSAWPVPSSPGGAWNFKKAAMPGQLSESERWSQEQAELQRQLQLPLQ